MLKVFIFGADFFATAQIFQASRPGFEQACQALREALAS